MAPPEDPESCRRLPEYTLDGFITKILGIFNTYKLHWSVLRNLSITKSCTKVLKRIAGRSQRRRVKSTPM